MEAVEIDGPLNYKTPRSDTMNAHIRCNEGEGGGGGGERRVIPEQRPTHATPRWLKHVTSPPASP